MDIIKAYATKNLCYIAARKMTPKGIVVHSTGANNPMLKRYVDFPDELGVNTYGNHWNRAQPDGRKVCVHGFIGYDKNNHVRVAEILPLDICCWGVGKGKKGSYNYEPAYIQFEICEDGLKNETYYRKAFGKAAEYAALLCKKFNIPVENIVGHCEAYKKGYGSNHSDPEHWMKNFGETMNDFRTAVSRLLKNSDVNRENTNETAKTVTKASFFDGDVVSIDSNAVYYNGKSIPTWVKAQNWYVKGNQSGEKVIVDKNEKGTNSICSPINAKYLTIVKKSSASNVKESRCPYRVKVTVPSLNIRKGAGTDTANLGHITDKGIYTIVEERTGIGASLWGKLKSGVGWISLDYVNRI